MNNHLFAKYSRRYLLIGIIAASILTIMTYSFYMSNRMISKYGPLIDAAMEIKLEATIAHLWFEEILSGDRSQNIETIIDHIDQSRWYANAMIQGGQNKEGTYLPLADPVLDAKIATVIEELDAYKQMTFERYDAYPNSGPGTEIDQRYDQIFNDFNSNADEVETLLQHKIASEQRLYRGLQSVLIIVVIVLSAFTVFIHLRFDRRHEADMAEISREVEVRKAAEEKLKELNALKDGFISIAAHELKSPLMVIDGYADLLLAEEGLGQAERTEYLQEIQTKALVLYRVVEEFLDVSRLESGHPISIVRSPVKIAAIAREVVKQLHDGDRHEFNVIFDDDHIEVDADPGRLHQVFENLISNAIKYSPAGGRIEVQGGKSGGAYQVSVKDFGIGISPEQQAQIFRKYYRAHAHDNSVKGLGIGLYFVKNIIELHGGQIGFESRLGEGTRFFFTLPLVNQAI